MTLLSHADYERIAANLSYPTEAFIGGTFAPALSGETMPTVNPATGKEIALVASCGREDVDKAVAAARKAFESGAWSRMHPSERKKILMRFIGLIEKHQVELAVLESLDSGKPVRECLLTDLPETIECLEWHAECADKQYGGISPSGDGRLGLIVREPAGVVACVLPWNFPLMMVGWKLGPALAEGNSVILKPASVTSLSTLKLAEFAAEAGIPEGVFNVITGPGSSVGEALGLHPGVDVVSFTGSTEVGRRFLEYAARSNLKRIVLELGGKSPFVVLDDVADYAAVAAQAAAAAFWNMGENCTANSRIIVPRKHKDAFTEALLAELENWRIGDPLDPENNLGSIVSEGQFRTIMGYIEKGKAEGGHVLTGGAPLAIGSGLFIPPTIFDGVTPDMTIVREEIFGPVTAILPADSDEEAVGLANATAYGLQATLFTEDVTKAHKYARALKAGTVSVNCFSEGDNTTPFGGYKLSGFGGKDKGRESHDQYTETKTIFLNLDHAGRCPPRRNVPVPRSPAARPGRKPPGRRIPGGTFRNGDGTEAPCGGRRRPAGSGGERESLQKGSPPRRLIQTPSLPSSPRRAPCTARPRRRAGGGAPRPVPAGRPRAGGARRAGP